MTLAQFDRHPERGYWISQWEIQQLTCSDCGHLISECSDPKRMWYPFRRVCYATMELQAADAAYTALQQDQPFHDGTFTSWAKDRSAKHPYEAREGVKFGIAKRDVAPHDKFTTEKNASPIEGLVAKQTPGQQAESADEADEEGDASDRQGDQ